MKDFVQILFAGAIGALAAYFNILAVPLVVLVAVMPRRRDRYCQKSLLSGAGRGRHGGRLSDFVGAGVDRYHLADQLLLWHDHHDLADHQRADFDIGKLGRDGRAAAVVFDKHDQNIKE